MSGGDGRGDGWVRWRAIGGKGGLRVVRMLNEEVSWCVKTWARWLIRMRMEDLFQSYGISDR